MSDSLDKTLNDLENKVSNYMVTSTKRSKFTGTLSKVNIKSLLIYGSIPAAIIFVIVSWKPSFVCKEKEDEDDMESHLSFKKVSITVISLSLILCGLMFMYLRKKEITL